MRNSVAFTSLMALGLLGPMAGGTKARHDAVVHERKVVAGLAVVFGAEPEPAITDEMQFLRWRISVVADSTAYTDLQDAAATVTRNGQRYGPFPVRPVRRDPGLYQTQHIFTEVGEYQSVLTFRKGNDPTVHSVDFTFQIRDRASLELPPRRPGG
ncbi:MAG TPA: hypothetical protein VNL18_04530 [Gemmatimonadales bacterium]|nr:hypothetical protein [Gemmatimonadales bacterium]